MRSEACRTTLIAEPFSELDRVDGTSTSKVQQELQFGAVVLPICRPMIERLALHARRVTQTILQARSSGATDNHNRYKYIDTNIKSTASLSLKAGIVLVVIICFTIRSERNRTLSNLCKF